MRAMKSVLVCATLLFGFVAVASAQSITVRVKDQDGANVRGFKWLLEEDNTHDPEPGIHRPLAPDVMDNSLSTSIHRSHAYVVASGDAGGAKTTITTTASGEPLPAGRYFVSVLPFGDRSACDGTYDMGGSPVMIESGNESVIVYVRQNPIETGQISIKVFHDILPLNNAPDFTEIDPENSTHPLLETMAGFTVTIDDQGGDIVGDAFGNPIGTTYLPGLDPDSCEPVVDVVGIGDYITPASGQIIIKNLAPGKYGVQVEPPRAEGWIQTNTIEGTKTIDAWIRPDEPPFLVEFGPPLFHVTAGFTKEFNALPAIPEFGASGTISGTINKGHLTRPPSIVFFNGAVPEGEAVGERCVVALNANVAGTTEAVYVSKCDDETGEFTIEDVPPGTYQIVAWDVALLQIIYFNTVVVPSEGGAVLAGDVDGQNPVPMWFAIQEHNIYNDVNRNAVRDPGELGIPEQNVNLRFRDGTIYKAFPTDLTGFVPFQAVFPFFHWLTAEVDFARFQATGLDVVVDDGGLVTNDDFGEGKRTPQDQTGLEGGDQNHRVEKGAVLVESFQSFAGTNTRFEWGKAPYDDDVNAVDTLTELDYFNSTAGWPGGAGDADTCLAGAEVPADCVGGSDGEYNSNGGISGIVFYATTRAEDDPRFAAGEEWEPGIPNLQVALYRDIWCASIADTPALYPLCPEATAGGGLGDGIPDDANDSGLAEYADVDNYPLNWAPDNCEGEQGVVCVPGAEDVDGGTVGVFDMGDAIRVAWTDSWDSNIPADCMGNAPVQDIQIHGASLPLAQCAEGLRTWNQVRPGVFDGGYAFGPGDPLLIPGTYIVKASTPPGYKTLKEEDRNVDFGITGIPALLAPDCVGLNDDGSMHTVPALFSFLTRRNGAPLPGVDAGDPDNGAPFAGEERFLCNAKQLDLGVGQNAAADFFVFTDVPKAARGVGLVTDDFANEIAPNKPAFTEKFSPPWIAIAVFDYTGREIQRTYGDEYGSYNFLAPSAYNVNPPSPSGIGPKMNQFCLNHPGPIKDPDNVGEFMTDPYYKAQYSTTCYQFNFETARTTYLDTPVIRQAAFVGALQETLDCEAPDLTPAIRRAYNVGTGEPALLRPGDGRLRILSLGTIDVPNPAFPGDTITPGIPDDPPSQPQFVERNFGFGTSGGDSEICIGDYCFEGNEIQNWTNQRIDINLNNNEFANALADGLETGQLRIRNSNGNSTEVGLTVTIDDGAGSVGGNILQVSCQPQGGRFCTGSIQDAIDAASPGDLILVSPGTYAELPILYKRVKLQGSGAGSTTIWGSHTTAGINLENQVVAWQTKLEELAASGDIGLLPEQTGIDLDFLFQDGRAPGILVAPVDGEFEFTGSREDLQQRARIDGFKIMLADNGGGIYVNAYGGRLLISNNEITSNGSNLGGGIRIGNPTVPQIAGVASTGGVIIPITPVETSPNTQIDIRNNDINQNGSFKTGGGITVFKGADSYNINNNTMCGNFARSGGGALAHRGLSLDGVISDNKIVFNEVFQGDQPGAGLGIGGGGGGIEIAGDPDIDGSTASGLTEGTGDVQIERNLIQGNLGGAADGGGIALRNVNGDDVASSPTTPENWWQIQIHNNLIVNNVSGLGGGGIALQDAARVSIRHNTIAHNDSTATGTFAFQGGFTLPTTPQPGGIVSRVHSSGLINAQSPADEVFSDPTALRRNIFYQNRSFLYDNSGAPGLQLQPNPDGAYWDIGVTGTVGPACMSPTQAVLTDLLPTADPRACNYAGNDNNALDPGLETSYFNDIISAAAADEGGNFVQIYFTPLGVTGDYHLGAGSLAIDLLPNDSNTSGVLAVDVDGEPRPSGAGPDTGADEVQQ